MQNNYFPSHFYVHLALPTITHRRATIVVTVLCSCPAILSKIWYPILSVVTQYHATYTTDIVAGSMATFT
jgi:hypothetical protein